jgi:hypothetical protein
MALGDALEQRGDALDHLRRQPFGRLVEMMRSGSPIKMRRIVSICCSPPEITPAGVAAISRSQGNSR